MASDRPMIGFPSSRALGEQVAAHYESLCEAIRVRPNSQLVQLFQKIHVDSNRMLTIDVCNNIVGGTNTFDRFLESIGKMFEIIVSDAINSAKTSLSRSDKSESGNYGGVPFPALPHKGPRAQGEFNAVVHDMNSGSGGSDDVDDEIGDPFFQQRHPSSSLPPVRVSLVLSDNSISNGNVLVLANLIQSYVDFHNTLQIVSLDLTNNVQVSMVGGKRLRRLVKEYPYINTILLTDCSVSASLMQLISGEIRERNEALKRAMEQRPSIANTVLTTFTVGNSNNTASEGEWSERDGPPVVTRDHAEEERILENDEDEETLPGPAEPQLDAVNEELAEGKENNAAREGRTTPHEPEQSTKVDPLETPATEPKHSSTTTELANIGFTPSPPPQPRTEGLSPAAGRVLEFSNKDDSARCESNSLPERSQAQTAPAPTTTQQQQFDANREKSEKTGNGDGNGDLLQERVPSVTENDTIVPSDSVKVSRPLPHSTEPSCEDGGKLTPAESDSLLELNAPANNRCSQSGELGSSDQSTLGGTLTPGAAARVIRQNGADDVVVPVTAAAVPSPPDASGDWDSRSNQTRSEQYGVASDAPSPVVTPRANAMIGNVMHVSSTPLETPVQQQIPEPCPAADQALPRRSPPPQPLRQCSDDVDPSLLLRLFRFTRDRHVAELPFLRSIAEYSLPKPMFQLDSTGQRK